MNKNLKTLLKIIVGVSILSFLIYRLGVGDIIDTFMTINLFFILPAFIALLLHYLFCIMGLKIVVDTFHAIDFKVMTKYYFGILAASFILPGRLGDLSFIYFLKKEGLNNSQTGAIFVIDKIMAFSFAVVMACIGLFYFFGEVMLWPALGLFIISAVGIIIVTNKRLFDAFKWFVPFRFQKFFNSYFGEIHTYFEDKNRVFKTSGIITIRWIFKAFILFFLFMAFNVIIWPQIILLVVCIEVFTSLIPFTLFGLGFRESLAVYVLSQVGIAGEITLSVYMIQLLMFYFTTFLAVVFYGKEV